MMFLLSQVVIVGFLTGIELQELEAGLDLLGGDSDGSFVVAGLAFQMVATCVAHVSTSNLIILFELLNPIDIRPRLIHHLP